MEKEKIKTILAFHVKYLNNDGGERADLRKADLQGANLQGANLEGADLRKADLQGANLQGANLERADLRKADLQGANLQGADLRKADLQGANLQGANLREADLLRADLWRADLQGANLREADLKKLKSERCILPEGVLIGYKKLSNGVICKLVIPKDSKRINGLTGRKCRAEYVKVLEGKGESPHPSGAGQVLLYEKGKTVRCVKPFDGDVRKECTSGIHFFITREEAEAFLI
jgi:hypothetical protein